MSRCTALVAPLLLLATLLVGTSTTQQLMDVAVSLELAAGSSGSASTGPFSHCLKKKTVTSPHNVRLFAVKSDDGVEYHRRHITDEMVVALNDPPAEPIKTAGVFMDCYEAAKRMGFNTFSFQEGSCYGYAPAVPTQIRSCVGAGTTAVYTLTSPVNNDTLALPVPEVLEVSASTVEAGAVEVSWLMDDPAGLAGSYRVSLGKGMTEPVQTSRSIYKFTRLPSCMTDVVTVALVDSMGVTIGGTASKEFTTLPPTGEDCTS